MLLVKNANESIPVRKRDVHLLRLPMDIALLIVKNVGSPVETIALIVKRFEEHLKMGKSLYV